METHKEMLDKAREHTDRAHETFLKTRELGVNQMFLNIEKLLADAEEQDVKVLQP